MLRRRGSAPAVVLQQHLSEPRGLLLRADRIIPPPDAPKLSKAKRSGKKDFERGCSPPPLALADRRSNELDYDSPSPKCPSPGSPGSPNLSKKPMKNRPKRRDSEPFIAQPPNTSTNTRNASSSLHRRSSSFRDYNIVLLGQGGVGKSGKSSLDYPLKLKAVRSLKLDNLLRFPRGKNRNKQQNGRQLSTVAYIWDIWIVILKDFIFRTEKLEANDVTWRTELICVIALAKWEN